jgi:hypothetical protein
MSYREIQAAVDKLADPAITERIRKVEKTIIDLADICRVNTLYSGASMDLINLTSVHRLLCETFVAGLALQGYRSNSEVLVHEYLRLTESLFFKERIGSDGKRLPIVINVENCVPAVMFASAISNATPLAPGIASIYDKYGVLFFGGRLFENEPCTPSCPTTSVDYTCCPSTAVSVETLRNCYVSHEVKEHAEILKKEIWDAKREDEIAFIYRSTLFSGSLVSSIVATHKGSPLGNSSSSSSSKTMRRSTTTTTTANASSGMTTTTKAPKPPNVKWSKTLLNQSLSFLGEDKEQSTQASVVNEGSDDGDDVDSDESEAEDDEQEEEEEEVNDDEATDLIVKEFEAALAETVAIDDTDANDPEESTVMQAIGAEMSKMLKSSAVSSSDIAFDTEPVSYGNPVYANRYMYSLSRRPAIDCGDTTLSSHPIETVEFNRLCFSVWADLRLAKTNHRLYENMFPCSCTTGLVCRVAYDCHIEEVRWQSTDGNMNLDGHSEAILAAAVELACGTLMSEVVMKPAFVRFVAERKNLFLRVAPALIHHAAACDNKSSTANDRSISLWAQTIGHWRDCNRVALTREQLVYFSPIARRITVLDAIRELESPQSCMFTRSVDLQCIVQHLCGLGQPDGNICQVSVLEPPHTWPCDVSWSANLASHISNTAVVPITGSAFRTYVVTTKENMNAFEQSTMQLALGGIPGSVPILAQSELLYPYAIYCLHRAPSPVLRFSAICFVSDVCANMWMANATHKKELQRYADDRMGGTLNRELFVRGRSLYEHERSAVVSSRYVWSVFNAAAPWLLEQFNKTQTYALLTAFARGIACISRPFATWVLSGGTEVYDAIISLLPMVRLEESSEGSCVYIVGGIKSDVHGRTLANCAILELMAKSLPRLVVRIALINTHSADFTSIIPAERDYVGDGVNWYKSDRTEEVSCNRPRGGVVRDSIAPSSSGTDTSGSLLCCCTAAVNILCKFECIMRNVAEPTDICPPQRLMDGSILAHRTCTNTTSSYVYRKDHVPLAENPMSLPRSRPPLCSGCFNQQHIVSGKGIRRQDANEPFTLPKNSVLFSELMHRTSGLCVLQHAWPTREIMDSYNDNFRCSNQPSFVKEYFPATVREILSMALTLSTAQPTTSISPGVDVFL